MEFQELADIINRTCPVSGADIYPNGTLILKRCRSTLPVNLKRGKVGKFTKQSLDKLIFYVAETRVQFVSMFTATYGSEFPKSGKAAKRHQNNFLNKLRYHYSPSYLWFCEFQERGAIHFHFLLTIEATTANRLSVAKLWVEATGAKFQQAEMLRVSSHKKAFEAIRKKDNAVSYLTAYATKKRQKTIPGDFSEMGRWWGASRDVKATIPRPTTAYCGDRDIREMYPRLANAPLLPKVIYASVPAKARD